MGYVRSEPEATTLVRIALTHYQFETIHPFSDGNGRIGRLLVVLQMIHEKLIEQPWLYNSPFLEKERDSYMDALYAVSAKGDYFGWIKLFLLAVLNSANDTLDRLQSLKALEAEFREKLARFQTQKPVILMERLFENPAITVAQAASLLSTSGHTARATLERLREEGIVDELTFRVRRRGRPPKLYFCKDILAIVR
jgi:Fic family protein